MSNVVALMIVGACTSFSGNGKEACSKGLEAAGKQSGIEQNIGAAEKKLEDNAKDKAQDWIGNTGMDIVGGTLFLVKTAKDKSVRFSTPTLGICDKITTEVGTEKTGINLEWRFK